MADGDIRSEHLLMHLSDEGGQKSKMQFSADSTVTLAKAFLATYCDALIPGASQIQDLACATVAAGDDPNVDRKLIVVAKDAITGARIRFVVSSYKEGEDLVFVATSKGDRLDPATGAAVCAAWKTANALPNALTFLSGTPVQRA